MIQRPFFRFWVFQSLFLFMLGVWASPGLCKETGAKKKIIPGLEETIRIALKNKNSFRFPEERAALGANNPRNRPPEETVYLVKKFYYQILYQSDQLSIAREVEKHFEKSISKSEEKFEEGEDITQLQITKLKLGLFGTRNDIIRLENKIRLAKLSLGKLMGWDLNEDSGMVEEGIAPVQFKVKSLAEVLGGDPKLKAEDLFDLQNAYHKVLESRDKMELAKNSRRMTRALLVAEVANYDFGIGDPEDLFEALIIYTRVLDGFYKSIYNFNLAVAELDRMKSKVLRG